jgi:hypothetical protein
MELRAQDGTGCEQFQSEALAQGMATKQKHTNIHGRKRIAELAKISQMLRSNEKLRKKNAGNSDGASNVR